MVRLVSPAPAEGPAPQGLPRAMAPLPRFLVRAFVAFLAPGAAGCHPALNMASAYDAQRPALTIPYTGVREDLRQYPDYGSIGASILVDEKAAPAKGTAPKKGRP